MRRGPSNSPANGCKVTLIAGGSPLIFCRNMAGEELVLSENAVVYFVSLACMLKREQVAHHVIGV